MTTLELLLDEARAKHTECLRQSAILIAKAEAFKESMDSLGYAVDGEKESSNV